MGNSQAIKSEVGLMHWVGETPAGAAVVTPSFDQKHLTQCVLFEEWWGDAASVKPPPWISNAQTANITIDYISGVSSGVIRVLTDSTSEAQAGNITHGDTLMVNMSKGPRLECRFRLAPAGAALTADERMVIGLGSAHANAEDALDSVTTNLWWRIEGTSLNLLVEADDGTTDTNDQDSGHDLVVSTWTTVVIDATDLTNIRFYVDVAGGRNFEEQTGAVVSMADLTADTFAQPIICLQRDAGTEANSLDVDYIEVKYDR